MRILIYSVIPVDPNWNEENFELEFEANNRKRSNHLRKCIHYVINENKHLTHLIPVKGNAKNSINNYAS